MDDQSLYFGFTNSDLIVLAKMFVILALALGTIYFIKKVIYPRVWPQLAAMSLSSASPNLSYKTYFLRLPLLILLCGVLYFGLRELSGDHVADLVLVASGLIIVFFPAYIFFHRTIKPYWASLPPAFTRHFQTSAPGYLPLRTPSNRRRAEVAGLIVLGVAFLVLFGRSTGLYDPHQPIISGVGVTDYIVDFRTTMPEFFADNLDQMQASKPRVLYLVEILVLLFLSASLLLFVVFPISNRIMLLIPSFNVRLTLVDHFGLLMACALGIGFGYLPALL